MIFCKIALTLGNIFRKFTLTLGNIFRKIALTLCIYKNIYIFAPEKRYKSCHVQKRNHS